MTRRKEVNELAMRLGVGGIGGVLEAGARDVADNASTEEVEVGAETEQTEKESEPSYGELEADVEIIGSSADAEHQPDIGIDAPPSAGPQYPEQHEMWEDWSTRVEPWSSIRQIADRAVGSVVSSSMISPAVSPSTTSKTLGATLEPTSVPWSAIHSAWAAQRSSRDLRRAWSKHARVRVPRESQPDDATEDELDALELEDGEEGRPIDEVVEKVKQDEDLDTHEKRLLGCIVDPGKLFSLDQ